MASSRRHGNHQAFGAWHKHVQFFVVGIIKANGGFGEIHLPAALKTVLLHWKISGFPYPRLLFGDAIQVVLSFFIFSL
ncbi:MAG: hypothetical protein U5K79_04080 [Cyclobacteriaceae bacterium]|nr:hypothetical protein [Cyclobacteriaceae bacterium]